MLKSMTLTVTIVLCDRTTAVPVIDGVVPVTVTRYVPRVPLHVSVLVPEPPGMLVGLSEHVRPVVGDALVDSAMVPVRPLSGVIVIVELALRPGVVLAVVGLATIWKSTTWTLIVGVL